MMRKGMVGPTLWMIVAAMCFGAMPSPAQAFSLFSTTMMTPAETSTSMDSSRYEFHDNGFIEAEGRQAVEDPQIFFPPCYDPFFVSAKTGAGGVAMNFDPVDQIDRIRMTASVNGETLAPIERRAGIFNLRNTSRRTDELVFNDALDDEWLAQLKSDRSAQVATIIYTGRYVAIPQSDGELVFQSAY